MGLPTGFDPAAAYRMMVRMRLADAALAKAWADGMVPGEYHSGIGEEGINAGIILHLSGEDSLSCDHRNTAPFIGRGADPLSLMLEVLGTDLGMNRGHAGHMHLLEPEIHAAADGMVGAAGPLAVGCAVAHEALHPGRVAIAFHGEGAMNQGMLLESYNLAVTWNLPVVFVCKDNRWSITTYSKEVTGGTAAQRAKAFGLGVETARGDRVEDVYAAAGKLISRARAGKGPGFLHVTCHRPAGHFEGDPIVRIMTRPKEQALALAPGLKDGALADTGGSRTDRASGLTDLTVRIVRAFCGWTRHSRMDPVRRGLRLVDRDARARIEGSEHAEINAAFVAARNAIDPRPTFRPRTRTSPIGGSRRSTTPGSGGAR